MILGIDEVGRGPWAGPLVVGAVILGEAKIEGLNDSKKLTAKKRTALDAEIREKAAAWALGWVDAGELDNIGMSQSLQLATRRAVEQIQRQCRESCLQFNEIIIDGTVNFLRGTALESYVAVMAKADGLIASVSAASIIAKVARDKYMAEQDKIYPGYGFASNAGYGVAKHRAAIEQLGVTPLHRLSFAPLAKYRTVEKSGEADDGAKVNRPTTRRIGDDGEQAVADWLSSDGHEIVARNWRTKWCEIDIISRRDDEIFFTEVKYRKNDRCGGGLAAITSKKHQQIRFAAELFIAKNPQLAALTPKILVADVTGNSPIVQNVIEVDD